MDRSCDGFPGTRSLYPGVTHLWAVHLTYRSARKATFGITHMNHPLSVLGIRPFADARYTCSMPYSIRFLNSETVLARFNWSVFSNGFPRRPIGATIRSWRLARLFAAIYIYRCGRVTRLRWIGLRNAIRRFARVQAIQTNLAYAQ